MTALGDMPAVLPGNMSFSENALLCNSMSVGRATLRSMNDNLR